MNSKSKKIIFVLFIFLVGVGIFFRFFNYNWGAPFYFHPDERNIASAVTRLEFPDNLNPEFFAYGSLPIYTIYLLGVIQNLITNAQQTLTVSFEQAIIFSRLISAVFSTSIIFITYFLLKKKLSNLYSILGTLLITFNVGLIQYAHFGTFEMWLTILFLLLFWSTLNYIQKTSINYLILVSLILGLLISVKVSSVVIAPILLASILIGLYKSEYMNRSKIAFFRKSLLSLLIVTFISTSVLITTQPYMLFDKSSFLNSMNYESGVALGNIKVFYTGGFANTIPVLYQFLFVYPYILNPFNFALLILSVPFFIYYSLKKKDKFLILALSFFAAIFISQAFFYVKWIRYYIPTIPFLIILIPFALKIFIYKFSNKNTNLILTFVSILLISASLLYSFSYFKTVLLDKDTRIKASVFASKNIDNDSRILSEVYDLGIVPFNRHFSDITLFDFYALDDKFQKDDEREKLDTLTDQSDYLILPSQRILRNRTIYEDRFTEGHNFYTSLDEKYKLIYKTECDIYCKILYMGDPIYNVEETANVFDRPTIMIYEIN